MHEGMDHSIDLCPSPYCMAGGIINTNLFDVSEKCNGEIEKVSLAFNAQQEAVHVLFKLASLAEDFLRITFSRLCELIGSNQQLLRVCDRVLTQTNTPRCTTTQLAIKLVARQ